MKKNISCMIFDFGGVIGLPHDKTRVETMKKLTNMNEEFEEAYFLHRQAYDEGLIDKYEYWNRITGGQVDLSEELVDILVKEDYYSWTIINQEVISYLRQVKTKVDKVVLLSNINFEAKNYIRDELQLFGLFDETFCSCDLNLMKPDSTIYKYVLKEINIEAAHCLFMDDSLANIQSAKEVGMNGIHFKNFSQFQKELLKNYDLCKS